MKILLAAIAFSFLSACGTLQGAFTTITGGVSVEEIDTANKGLVVAASQISNAAKLTASLTRSGAITPAQATLVRDGLQTSLDAIQSAKDAIEQNGDPSQAGNAIDTAQTALGVALTLLSGFTGQDTSYLQYKMEGYNDYSDGCGGGPQRGLECYSLA
jgi:hypothetical protein